MVILKQPRLALSLTTELFTDKTIWFTQELEDPLPAVKIKILIPVLLSLVKMTIIVYQE